MSSTNRRNSSERISFSLTSWARSRRIGWPIWTTLSTATSVLGGGVRRHGALGEPCAGDAQDVQFEVEILLADGHDVQHVHVAVAENPVHRLGRVGGAPAPAAGDAHCD